ncbi:unnamed protein product [Trichogramma brassicae]|uniref:Uncharacterized protein n=1 Tax=Trichogramma brassicae TaxID=86971 RepID=A0A6H5J6R5_9HYME|nr:unnamed protein product [Trichogramma brassicae]
MHYREKRMIIEARAESSATFLGPLSYLLPGAATAAASAASWHKEETSAWKESEILRYFGLALVGTLNCQDADVNSTEYRNNLTFFSLFRLYSCVCHTLTGHSNKVMAAKFLGDATKVVTGSYDRTLKIWDLRSKACKFYIFSASPSTSISLNALITLKKSINSSVRIETKFAGSSCNDLVTSDGSGSTIISGHFDKTIRFWDTRTETGSNLQLQGKITSLDLSRDANFLLSCVRDDTLKLIDLRMKMIVSSFSADGFKVVCDWSRACFSPDGQYVAVGSSDGSIFVWSVNTNKIETILKDHTTPVTAVSWYPHGAFLASVNKAKWATIWGDV